MTNQRELELLSDIVALLKKYGPEVFERLTEMLTSVKWQDPLVALLQAVSASDERMSTTPTAAPAPPLRPKALRTVWWTPLSRPKKRRP